MLMWLHFKVNGGHGNNHSGQSMEEIMLWLEFYFSKFMPIGIAYTMLKGKER